MYVLWFSFILGSVLISFVLFVLYHTQKQRKVQHIHSETNMHTQQCCITLARATTHSSVDFVIVLIRIAGRKASLYLRSLKRKM